MDIQQLTLGEIATVERVSGQALANLSDTDKPKGELLSALALVIKRRTEPSYTLEQAQNLTMADIDALLEDEEPEKKG